MKPADPVIVVHLFPVLLKKLLELLTSLGPEEWQKPTPCPAWSVHDVALHLLGVDMGELSRGRDKFETSYIQAHGWDELVTSLNRQNERWVIATRGISPFLLTETLGFTGEQACLHFSSLDPSSTGPTVSWAGSGPAPMWLHVAREYTERWHHQQQIREATGRPLLTNPEMFAPVLATFVRALPRAFFQVPAAEGSIVRLIIEGESGGNW
ncbi:MAG: maleylpyruvate isomerase family mycothiol-dependent enzyme, partial [Chloroflexi bacterium]|nr:maleylpyruvate isomerase family mycothiol-dependent enzyme [Chloroflexota bacterium]